MCCFVCDPLQLQGNNVSSSIQLTFIPEVTNNTELKGPNFLDLYDYLNLYNSLLDDSYFVYSDDIIKYNETTEN